MATLALPGVRGRQRRVLARTATARAADAAQPGLISPEKGPLSGQSGDKRNYVDLRVEDGDFDPHPEQSAQDEQAPLSAAALQPSLSPSFWRHVRGRKRQTT